MCHCIRKTLNIKDENITFDEKYLTEEKYRNVLALVFNGTLPLKLQTHVRSVESSI